MGQEPTERVANLKALAELEGYESVEALLEVAQFDCVIPGICTTAGCTYTVEVEPDQREGFCEACGTSTVQSALVLAERI